MPSKGELRTKERGFPSRRALNESDGPHYSWDAKKRMFTGPRRSDPLARSLAQATSVVS